ncbi:cobalamin-dependent protein [Archangium sp.]|uniref:cobalamin B12-binding domain-containing protein n=1 Tax=Archangium sp. TaxID=1872627 RepID=UPI00286B3A86|nr:cobalamin-dependent protein [Archangium sp.]
MAVREQPGSEHAGLATRYLETQLAGDLRGALRLLDEALARGASITDLQCHVIQAAQREVGALWWSNQIGVAREHQASAISQVALAHLFSQAQPEPSRGISVALACVEGELHELPARLVCDFLELAGFTVSYFGGNLPTDSLLSLLEQERPDVVALSVTMTFNLPALRRTLEGIRKRLGEHQPILVGGPALVDAPGLLTELKVSTAGQTPAELVAGVLDALRERRH